MSLPIYTEPRLTLARLTDEIIDAALEDAEYLHVSTNTARSAVYDWLSHSAVWDDDLEGFAAEVREDDFSEPLGAVTYLASKVEEQLNRTDEDMLCSRISIDAIQDAVIDTGRCSSMPAEQIRYIIASVLVEGTSAACDEWDDVLSEYGLAMDDILSIIQRMEET